MKPERLLHPAVADDIPAIAALEQVAHALPFVGQWSQARHRNSMADPDFRYFVAETSGRELAAYVILRGLGEDSGSIELKRIVVSAPGRGFGRKILQEAVRIAFEELHAHRLFLDVFEDNARALHLYESLGFHHEGTMRAAARRNGNWCNLYLMSLLESEYYKGEDREP